MYSHRFYGMPPYRLLLLHGGPGAPGSLAPLADLLKERGSLIEHLQQGNTIDGQLNELHHTIVKICETPVTIIGHSWGAWLGWIYAAGYTELVKKLIMIGAAPFEEKYADRISPMRMQRLSNEERESLHQLSSDFEDADYQIRKEIFRRLGKMVSKADTLAPVSEKDHVIDYQPEVFENIWPNAAGLRSSGKLLELAGRIRCPVTAIHGDYDPHPPEGVEFPLSENLDGFKMIRLEKCGHYPWNERYARNKFAAVLKKEIS